MSSDLLMFTDATPPLSKHGGWPRLHATPGEAPKPARGLGEPGGLLVQGQLRRNMDPGKHAAGSATAPSLAHLWAQAAPKLIASIRPCSARGTSRGGGSWEPPVPAGSHQVIPEPGSSIPSLSFHTVQRGETRPQEQGRSLECEFGVPLRKPTPAEGSAFVTTGQNQPRIPAGSHPRRGDSATSLPLFTNNELATKHVPRNA